MEAQTTYDVRLLMVHSLFEAQKCAGLCYGTDSSEYREIRNLYETESRYLHEKQEAYSEARRMFLVIKNMSDKMGEEETQEDFF